MAVVLVNPMREKRNGIPADFIEALRSVADVCLLAVVALGIWLRLSSFPAYVADSGDEWGNTVAPLRLLHQVGDPGTFFHPSLYYYATSVAYLLVYGVARVAGASGALESMTDLFVLDERSFVLAARVVSTLAALLTIAGVYWIGRTMWSSHAGLISASLLALLPAHLHYSKTVRVDALAVFLFVVAVWAMVEAVRDGRRRKHDGAAVAVGLATGANYTGALLGPWLWLAAWLGGRCATGDEGRWGFNWRAAARPLVIAASVFALASPFVLLNYGRSVRDLSFILGLSVETHSGWEARDAFYYLQELLQWSPSLVALVAGACASMLFLGNRAERFLVSIAVIALALFSVAQSKDMRFVLPVLALLCVVCGGIYDCLARRVARGWLWRSLLLLPCYGLVASSLSAMTPKALYPIVHERLLRPDAHVFDWIEENVPRRSRVVVESGILPLLDIVAEDGELAVAVRESLVRVRPGLDQHFIGAVYIGGCNYEPEKVARREIDFAVVSQRNVHNVERRCEELAKVCEFYAQLREHGRAVFTTPPGHEQIVVYDVRESGRASDRR